MAYFRLWLYRSGCARMEPIIPCSGTGMSSYWQPNEPPKFLQVYFIDSHVQETDTRMNITSGLKQNIVQELSLMLHQENQYVQNLQTAQEYFRGNDTNEGWKVVIYEEKRPRTEHARRFNRPASDEIGILMPNEPTNN